MKLLNFHFPSQVLHYWWRSVPVLHSEQPSHSQQNPLHSHSEGNHVQGEIHHAEERERGEHFCHTHDTSYLIRKIQMLVRPPIVAKIPSPCVVVLPLAESMHSFVVNTSTSISIESSLVFSPHTLYPLMNGSLAYACSLISFVVLLKFLCLLLIVSLVWL